jgi:hypothetical protein
VRRSLVVVVNHRNRPARIAPRVGEDRRCPSAVGASGSGRSKDGGLAIATTLTD